ncbi:hypothetical protein Q9Q75_17290 [Mycobacterium intracellulare]|uniref:hypothetical protein n=1 Tax=Mycobacterium intracellulare TaxID=1767 RepID=UPI00334DC44C
MADQDPARGQPDTPTIEEHGGVDAESAAEADTGSGTAAMAATKRQLQLGGRLALCIGVFALAALAGTAGWLGYRFHLSHNANQQQMVFLQVGRQAAVNLTTIDFSEVDVDVKRIIDSSLGSFRDDFEKRSPAFIAVVKQAQSKSKGTVTAAGVESVAGNEAQVLVAVSVETTIAVAPQPQLHSWRMRISVRQVDDNAKVSDVQFVP